MWKHNTAEIMGHPGTDADVFDTIVAFAKSIGMVALPLKKEQPSYIVNSLLVPLLGAGLDLLVRGKHLTGFTKYRRRGRRFNKCSTFFTGR
jgi:3-hydroxyacyl-CoA dehydrogenase